MNKSIIIHILNECNLACDLCYACSPKRDMPIKKEEIETLVAKGLLISPKQLTKIILQIPKNYEIFLRGGEISLYPEWDELFLSFAKLGYKINIDTNGQWVPKSNDEIEKRFLKILKNLKHDNLTVYFSYDKWHEKKDAFLKERTKIFLKYAEEYELNYFIFATGLNEEEIKEYYKDLNIDFNKVRFNPLVYKLGKRKNDPSAVEYKNHKENELLVIDPRGDIYPCLQSCSEKNNSLQIGNIKYTNIKNLIERLITKEAWQSLIPANDLDKHMLRTKQVRINVNILQKMLKDFAIKENTNILIPGCGTGQIFEYLNSSELTKCQITFTDINEEYLKKLRERINKKRIFKNKVLKDDIETTKLKDHFDLCILILILEHVDWKKTLKNILKLGVTSFYIIIQNQNHDKEMVTTYEDIPESIKEFSKNAKSHLIQESELNEYFETKEFVLLKRYHEKAIDNKEMIGLVYKKK